MDDLLMNQGKKSEEEESILDVAEGVGEEIQEAMEDLKEESDGERESQT